MSKKFLAIFLALFLTISSTFAGCAGVKDPTNDGEDPTVTDTVAPELSGLDESYKGVKGRRFVLPVPVVTDNMDKNPTYTVQVKDPKSNEIELEEDGGEKAFVPESVGDYFATYHAKDSAGLTSQKSITINVLLNEGPTIVIGDTVVESVGETPVAIQLPVPTITDVTGVAITEYTVTVKDRSNQDVAVSADKKITVADGKYLVTYKATDIDNLHAEKTIVLTVGEDNDPFLNEGEEYLINVSKPGDQLNFSFYTATGDTKGTVVDDPDDLFNKLIYAENIKDLAINTVTMDTVNHILPTDITRYSKIMVRVGNPTEEAFEVNLARSNNPSRYSGDPVLIQPGEFAWVTMDLLKMSESEDLTDIDALWVVCGNHDIWLDRVKMVVNPSPVILGLENTTLASVGDEPQEVQLPVPTVIDAQQENIGFSVEVTDKTGKPVVVTDRYTITVADGMYKAVYTATDDDDNTTTKTIIVTVGKNDDYDLSANEELIINFETQDDAKKIGEWSEAQDVEVVQDPQNIFNNVLSLPDDIPNAVFGNEWMSGVCTPFLPLDLSAYSSIRVRVYNPTENPITINMRNNNGAGIDGESVTVQPATWDWIRYDLVAMQAQGGTVEGMSLWIILNNQKVYIDYVIGEKNAAPVILGMSDTEVAGVGNVATEISLPVPSGIRDDKDTDLVYTVTVKNSMDESVTVTDNKILVTDGMYELTYSVTDSDLNTTTRVIILTVGKPYELAEKEKLLLDVNSDADLGKIRSWGTAPTVISDPTNKFNKVLKVPGAGITEVVINNDNFGGVYVIGKDISAYSKIRIKIYNPNEEAVRAVMQNLNRDPSVTGTMVTIQPGTWEWLEFDLTAEGLNQNSTDIWIGLPDGKDVYFDYLIVTEK